MLVRCWHNVNAMLALVWRDGEMFWNCWRDVGAMLAPRGRIFAALLASCLRNFGEMVAQCELHVGAMLAMMAQAWRDDGAILAL